MQSIKGAATEIESDAELCPVPKATPKDESNLKQYTATIVDMMGKFDATVNTRGMKKGSVKVSETMFTEGLGSFIGLKRVRGQTRENYVTVVPRWLTLGGTDFTKDVFLQDLMEDWQKLG